MDPVVVTPGGPELDGLRHRRAKLRESMSALEKALAAPASGRVHTWNQHVDAALATLAENVRDHISTTEGPHGFHQDIVAVAPRLASAVRRLVADHERISETITALIERTRDVPRGGADTGHADEVRDLGTSLLAQLVRHRQRGADLIFEAYQADIGGET
jgi:hypothetical protein